VPKLKVLGNFGSSASLADAGRVDELEAIIVVIGVGKIIGILCVVE
jgi:hypothetical protein